MVSVITALVFLIFELQAATLLQPAWEISIFMHYDSASLFFLGSSIFLAW